MRIKKRFSKSMLSIILSLCLLVSCVVVGVYPTNAIRLEDEAVGASLTSTGSTYIFVSTRYAEYEDGSGAKEWGNGVYFVAVFRDSDDNYYTESTHVAGVWVENINGTDASGGQIYRFQVPSGTWSYVRLFRGRGTLWSDMIDETKKIELNTTNNMLTYFQQNQEGYEYNWEGTYQYDSTANLSASATEITTSGSATLTPSLSSNGTYNSIKSVSYKVLNGAGSETSNGTVTKSGNNGTFSATCSGIYKVQATVTYNANGYSGITKTATAEKTIKVTNGSYNLHYETITNGNGGNYYLSNKVAFSAADGSGNRTATVSNVPAAGIYLFAATSDATQSKGIYYKRPTDKTAITTSGSLTLTEYDNKGNYGDLAGKVKFIPASNQTGAYTFTFNVSSKTLTVARAEITYTGLSATATVTTGAASANLSASIQSTSATNIAGTTVTAVNNDSSQYTFKGWSSAGGTFANVNSLSTTFYPSANNAVATARFEENSYTVTVSKGNAQAVSPASITAHPYTTYALSQITVTPKNGYRFSGWSVSSANLVLSGASSSDSTQGTLTAKANGTTLTPNFTEILHTVSVVKRFYDSNGHLDSSENAASLTGVGVATAGAVSAPAEVVGNYKFDKYTLDPSSSSNGLSVASGSLTQRTGFSVYAAADNCTVYIDYTENLHQITLETDGQGSIQRNGSTVTSTLIGNINAVSLTPLNNQGYNFSKWIITPGTATTVTVNGENYTFSGNPVTINHSDSVSGYSFKFNGTATLRAEFVPESMTINVSFPANHGYDNANSVRVTNTEGVTIQRGNYNTDYIIEVTLADGYEVASITGASSPTMPTPTKVGNVWKYQYTFSSTNNIVAVVTLKAVKPTVSGVQIKDTTFEFTSPANNSMVNHYYLQPNMAKAVTESFATLTFTNTCDSEVHSSAGVSSNTEVSLASPSVTLNAEDAYVDYSFKVKAVNAKPGVTAQESDEFSLTIRVIFNDAQKVFFRLNKLLHICVENPDSGYFKSTDKLGAYNTEYAAAKTKTMPAYNASAADKTEMEDTYNSFKTAYENLGIDAKTTTVYALTNFANNSSRPVNFKVSGNGNAADLAIFRMFTKDASPSMYAGYNLGGDSFHMSFDGTYKKSGNRYLYKITYAGHVNFRLWVGNNSSDYTDTGKYLTTELSGATDFSEYYVNAYSATPGSSPSVNSCSKYIDFSHTKDSGKKFVELGEEKTAAQIKSLFNFTLTGSMVTAPNIETTNVSLKIEGPLGKPNSSTYTLINTDNPSGVVAKFPADKQGKYTVTYVTRVGTDVNGNPIDVPATASLWVAYDDIDIYVDMNDNVGIPILNFKYYEKNGSPVVQGTSGATEAYLPYEMNLVTGSESVYKYTIKLSKLNTEYKIPKNPHKISYIMVEGEYVDGSGRYATKAAYNQAQNKLPFSIADDAHITGEMWLKADSTNLTTFQTISYGTVTKSLLAVAVAENSDHTLLPAAIGSVRGTGIHTDDDEVYHARYAGMYTQDGASSPLYNFNYVLNVSAKKEVTVGSGASAVKYYFDKWVEVETPDGITVQNGMVTTPLTDTLYSDSPDLNFTAAPDYDDGDHSYVALYKPVSSSDTTVRVDITYHFKDYNTSDGNYIYDPDKTRLDESYTKTVKVNGTFNSVKADVERIAGENAPYIVSNYFDYEYTAQSAAADNDASSSEENKVVVNANLTETARTYTIIAKCGAATEEYEGFYQQQVELKASELNAAGITNPTWKIVNNAEGNDQVIGTGATVKVRFVSSRNEMSGSTDCQIVKLVSDSGVAVLNNTSVVSNSFTEVYYNNSTEMLRHNFYIIDYCAKGKLVGGGVLFATTDLNGNYRQNSATTNLATKATRESFISGILNGDFSTEYKAQTINNIGFRYTPDNEEVFRYSGELSAYLTVFEGTNVNSENYQNQKLRLFSFMVYNSGTAESPTYVIVPSEGYAEVDRYINTTQS